jgi:hypothetical protein
MQELFSSLVLAHALHTAVGVEEACTTASEFPSGAESNTVC